MFFYEFEKRFQQNQDFVIIFLDLDGFKRVNDTFGHEIGDYLLKRGSSRINIIIEQNHGLLARYAGDDFVILLNKMKRSILEEIAERLLIEVKKEYQLANYRTLVTASIGIGMYPQEGTTLDELLRNAEVAMNEAKRKGRNQFYFFQDLANSSEYKILLELLFQLLA